MFPRSQILSLVLLQLAFACQLCAGASVAGALDVSTGRILFGADAKARIELPNGSDVAVSTRAALELQTADGTYPATSVRIASDVLRAEFQNGAAAEFKIKVGQGFALFQLVKLSSPGAVSRLKLFEVACKSEAQTSATLNGAVSDGCFFAVMAAEPNVHAVQERLGSTRVDRKGCGHVLASAPGKVGGQAAEFSAWCDAQAGGWSCNGRSFSSPLDLTDLRAVRVWVHGDGRGQQLKIQLFDGSGGYRDDYVPINFTGWKLLTLTNPALNTIKCGHVSALNLYYNGLPASTGVTCVVDHIEAVIERNGETRTVVLEDFEQGSRFLSEPGTTLRVQTELAHGIEPAAFGVLICPEDDFNRTMERFEIAAGLPHPNPGGVWNKRSPRVKRSYLFLTDFRESEFEEGLALARRGGFDTVLLGQESWTVGTGHYHVNKNRYKNGLEGLKRVASRFKDAGFHVGLHVLGASIYPPDPYITPVPDRRLVTRAETTLAASIDSTTNYLPVAGLPEGFPDVDGGYMGAGTVLRIGDELINYGSKATPQTPGFTNCTRGHLGSRPASHQKGEPVRHLVRAYGYHLYDLDSSLREEVAGHFAAVADACAIDMVYFDGSELLQGDHWYYNARLLKGFYDSLKNKDLLFQASSYSHYSWHMLARSASADGHGDLKGYLDQRSGGFASLKHDHMPLDIGWYYGYDPTSTPDMFEYVLLATLAYDSSMSFQVSCQAARDHPFTGEILDLIARYERLRLSGAVPDSLRGLLSIDPALTHVRPGESQPELTTRRKEYRLLNDGNAQVLQRVVYGEWHEIKPADTNSFAWDPGAPVVGGIVGCQIHAPRNAGIMDPEITLGAHQWAWSGPLTNGQFLVFWPGERVAKYAPGLDAPELGARCPSARSQGSLRASFTAKNHTGGSVRVRFTFQPGDRIQLKQH